MFFNRIIDKLLEIYFFLHRKKKSSINLTQPKKFLIVRQHNQFGDLLASVSLFRAIKEVYPQSSITVIVSPDNYYALSKNKFIDRTFIFNKSDLINPRYIFSLSKILKDDYDFCIVPVTVAISTTSCLLSGLSNSKFKIGPASLGGKQNKYSYIFDQTVNMDWSKTPKRHVSDFGQDILQPLGIITSNLKSEISFDSSDFEEADRFLNLKFIKKNERPLIGLHVGAGKVQNRWGIEKFAELINIISKKYDAAFYLTGTDSDMGTIFQIQESAIVNLPLFVNRSIPAVAALISKSDLFITNDTGIMHVAGAVDTPQISIFGPTNPNNWAPIGEIKYWIKKGNEIDSVTVKDVFELVKQILD